MEKPGQTPENWAETYKKIGAENKEHPFALKIGTSSAQSPFKEGLIFPQATYLDLNDRNSKLVYVAITDQGRCAFEATGKLQEIINLRTKDLLQKQLVKTHENEGFVINNRPVWDNKAGKSQILPMYSFSIFSPNEGTTVGLNESQQKPSDETLDQAIKASKIAAGIKIDAKPNIPPAAPDQTDPSLPDKTLEKGSTQTPESLNIQTIDSLLKIFSRNGEGIIKLGVESDRYHRYSQALILTEGRRRSRSTMDYVVLTRDGAKLLTTNLPLEHFVKEIEERNGSSAGFFSEKYFNRSNDPPSYIDTGDGFKYYVNDLSDSDQEFVKSSITESIAVIQEANKRREDLALEYERKELAEALDLNQFVTQAIASIGKTPTDSSPIKTA